MQFDFTRKITDCHEILSIASAAVELASHSYKASHAAELVTERKFNSTIAYKLVSSFISLSECTDSKSTSGLSNLMKATLNL